MRPALLELHSLCSHCSLYILFTLYNSTIGVERSWCSELRTWYCNCILVLPPPPTFDPLGGRGSDVLIYSSHCRGLLTWMSACLSHKSEQRNQCVCLLVSSSISCLQLYPKPKMFLHPGKSQCIAHIMVNFCNELLGFTLWPSFQWQIWPLFWWWGLIVPVHHVHTV